MQEYPISISSPFVIAEDAVLIAGTNALHGFNLRIEADTA